MMTHNCIHVPVPKPGPLPQICVWSDFSLKDIDELKLLQQTEDARRKIAEILVLKENDDHMKKLILTDLFYYAFIFATESKFNEEQISAFLSIIKRTHEKAIESPFGNIEDSFSYFKELLLRHCVKRPPFSIQLYDMSEAKKITDYVLDTYFKHYKLYKYAFTAKVRLDLTFSYNGLPEEPEESVGGAGETEVSIDPISDGGTDEEGEEHAEEEEPEAVKELRTMINSTLTDEVHKLKLNVDHQLKANEEAILKKMSEVTGIDRAHSRKSRKK